MNFEDWKNLYIAKKNQFGADAYKQIPVLLQEAEVIHREDWQKCPTKGKDYGQSWRAFKGKNLQKLIQYILTDAIEGLGLKVVNGDTLEKTINLSQELSQVKRNVLVNYGNFGCYLPDADIVIYQPDTCKVLAVISSKASLRERIAQTGYWKLKFLDNEATKHIKVYLVSPNGDKTLKESRKSPKARAIVEVELDGTYLLTEEKIPESEKIKLFEHFIDDLKKVLDNSE